MMRIDKWLLLLIVVSHCKGHEIEFIKYPHSDVFGGELSEGTWLVGDAAKAYFNLASYDRIQMAAVEEGVFIPLKYDHPGGSHSWHLFSSMDARACLSNKTLDFAGDSYMKQFAIGLMDIILESPSDKEIYGRSHRTAVMHERIAEVSESNDPSISSIHFHWLHPVCEHEEVQCFVEHIIESPRQADVFAINVFVHPSYGDNMDQYLTQLSELFDISSTHLIWATGLYHEHEGWNASSYNLDAKAYAISKSIPMLDMYTLTRTCPWRHCYADGSHRSRFVNRMKAQMLLNLVCRVRHTH